MNEQDTDGDATIITTNTEGSLSVKGKNPTLRTESSDQDATTITSTAATLRSSDATIKTADPTEKPSDATVKSADNYQQSGSMGGTIAAAQTNYARDLPIHDSNSLQVGSKLKNRFILREVLGGGGMGTVFRATDLIRLEARDETPDVAIKVLNEEYKHSPELFIALQRETKKTLQLAHPNIITVYDFDRDGNNVFMVMEILEGRTLTQFIKESAPNGLPFKKAWPIIKDLALALAYAHKRNIVHSDFKPGNVFIKSNGEVKVLDFGIASVVQRSDKPSNHETIFNARDLGALTPAYASLEMFQNKPPDPSDDIYALACVAYELLTGKHPFGKLSALKAHELNLQPPAISGLHRRQSKALAHALALTRAQRTRSIAQFIDEIEPHSLVPSLLIGTTVIALLAAAGSYIYAYFNIDPLADKVMTITPAQKLKIKDLLELAQIHFDVGFITAPSGSNALWAYRQVLDIDPYNKPAKQGLEKIANLMEEQAKSLFEQHDVNGSLAKIEEGLEAIPKHDGLLKLKKQVLESEDFDR